MTLLVEAGLGFYKMRKGEGTNLNGLTQVHFPSSVAVTLVGITGGSFGPWATYSMSLLSYYPKKMARTFLLKPVFVNFVICC